MGEQKLKNLAAAMEIVETMGVRLHHPGRLEIAADKGIRIKNGKVFFAREQLMEWISHAPSELKISARNPEHDLEIRGGRTDYASDNSGVPFGADTAGNIRPALFSDCLKFLKLVHARDIFHIAGNVMVTPEDLDNDGQALCSHQHTLPVRTKGFF